VSGNRNGRPKLDEDVREYLRQHRGPLTIAALKATEELLASRNQSVRARVANNWLNKELPDATEADRVVRWLVQVLTKELADEPVILRRILTAIARAPDAPHVGGAGPNSEDGGGGEGGEALRSAPAEPATG
jgi:hypothetical protein